jgi:hypothetical protein
MPITSIQVSGGGELVGALMKIPNLVGAKKIKPAVERGARVTVDALRSFSPRGPTGNLQRAADVKAVTYGGGTAVAVVGYRRAGQGATTSSGGTVRLGPDRAYHQYWIEYGTKERTLKKSAVASNFAAFGGNFGDYFEARGRGKAGWSGAVVVFRPKDGSLGSVEAQHPMEKAWEATKAQAVENIEQELAKALTEAVQEARTNV